MARIFLTKVWGFSPEDYPVLGFHDVAARQKFLRESKPGDWVVLAGTKTAPTRREYRGRLLGRVQLGTEEIDVVEVLRSVGTEMPAAHFKEGGQYRWPYGLPMIHAERFPELPDLRELFGDYLSGFQWATYALDLEEKLGDEAVARVEALEREPATIVEAPAIIRQRARRNALAQNRKLTGPGPSSMRAESIRVDQGAIAYLLKLEGPEVNVFKIGYTADLSRRLKELDQGLLSTLTGYSWKAIQIHTLETENHAYQFEQTLHGRLRDYRVPPYQEVYRVDQKTIESIWGDVCFQADWAIPEEQ